MKSLASLSLLLLVAAAPVQEPPAGPGPRGSSGEARYDAVGLAATGALDGVRAASTVLPAGSFAEVTALDTGRTIVVALAEGSVPTDRVVTLSPGAATALGLTGDRAPVRIRKVVPTPQDIAQLQGGGAASFRADAPPALLVALRKLLPAAAKPVAAAPTLTPPPAKVASPKPAVAKPTPAPTPSPVAAPPKPKAPKPLTSGYVVQVAALSNAARAATVAKAVGGTILPGPPTWRVRLGPYPDTAAATRAKAQAARAGYPGGQISRFP